MVSPLPVFWACSPFGNSHHPSWEQAQGVNHRVGGGVGLTSEILECPQTPLGGPPAWYYQGLKGRLSVKHSQLEPCPYLPHSQSPTPHPWSSCLRTLGATGEKRISPALTSIAGVTSQLNYPSPLEEGSLLPDKSTVCSVVLGWGGLVNFLVPKPLLWLNSYIVFLECLAVPLDGWISVYLPRSVPLWFFTDCSKRDLGSFAGFSL